MVWPRRSLGSGRPPLEDPSVGPTLPSHTLALGEAWKPDPDLSSARPGPVGRYNRSVPRAGDSQRKPKLLPTLCTCVTVQSAVFPHAQLVGSSRNFLGVEERP